MRRWEKIYHGLLRMYRAEVLGKVPIMQHFLFGTIIPFKSTAPRTPHARPPAHTLRGDCCGNPLPSIFAAIDAAKASDAPCAHSPLSKLPFD